MGDLKKSTARLNLGSAMLTVQSYSPASQPDLEPLATIFRDSHELKHFWQI